jgi:hypothetical protein
MSHCIARCGTYCDECSYREKTNCPTCHATAGQMFWGKCRLAQCSIDRDLDNCSQCTDFPCALLHEFAFDEKQGDNGKRIENLKKLKNV